MLDKHGLVDTARNLSMGDLAKGSIPTTCPDCGHDNLRYDIQGEHTLDTHCPECDYEDTITNVRIVQ